MKRVKAMFVAILILGGAAATLAVKARYAIGFCTTTATTTLVAGQQVYTCTFLNAQGQPMLMNCPNFVWRKFTVTGWFTATVCTTNPTTVDGELTCANRICTTATTKLEVE